MKLDEKRKVIEVLLCAGADANDAAMVSARNAVGVGYGLVWNLIDKSYERREPVNNFNERLMHIAYRLIESSPTLRREWFGAP